MPSRTQGCGDELASDWMILDAKLMPWSAKSQELLKQQYAAVGAAGKAELAAVVSVLENNTSRSKEAEGLLFAFRERAEAIDKFTAAYRQYCWPVHSLDDYKLAPFHLLASEGRAHTDKPHTWHMETLAKLASAEPQLFRATPYRVVDLNKTVEVEAATDWWLEVTGTVGEGMVVKPFDFVYMTEKGLVQPTVKWRWSNYQRIICGPVYLALANLDRLRSRGLGRKRAFALGEFALGIEALDRFVNCEPLRRIHECVFGVLALESEPLDP